MKNWSKLLVLTAFITVSISISPLAKADEVSKPFQVRGGMFFPTDSFTKDLSEDSWLTAGLEWRFKETKNDAGTQWVSISADWAGKDDLYSIPVLLNYGGQVKGFFGSIGVGFSFVKVVDYAVFDDENGETAARSSTTDTLGDPLFVAYETATKLAMNATVGYEFEGETPISVQGQFRWVDGGSIDGYAVIVGVRF